MSSENTYDRLIRDYEDGLFELKLVKTGNISLAASIAVNLTVLGLCCWYIAQSNND